MTEPKRSTLAFRRFCGFGDGDTIELTAFGDGKRIQVAYCRTVADQLRLLEAAERQSDLKGVYTIFNACHEGLYARIGEGRWVQGAPRTSDAEIVELRAVYCDVDVARPRDISATAAEKVLAHDVAAEIKANLATAFGTDTCLGFGDSGNGYAIFVAVEPALPTRDTTARIQRFLKAVAARFERPGVKIDPAVCNPARLCPAFGTLKRKGVNCTERPHRMTSFRCAENVTRIPLEAL
jgi:hypothetical protein